MASDLREQLQTTLGDTYRVERELGGGGMSRVFVADEARLGRKVVIKLLSPELAAGVSAERFEREIKVAASLQQANIVPVLSAGDTNGLPYYTMPFVEGESLRSRLMKGESLSITETVRILGDVARALSYAHEHGVAHRDIKPDNVLLSHGTAVVTDFGIAKAISASRAQSDGATLTQLGTSLGTPAYMSPEQAAGDPDVDHRADIYAFGCMAYELLAGHPPFHGRTPARTLAAQLSEVPEPIAALRPDAPATLTALVMQCLEKEVGARPASAMELVRVLDNVTSGSGLQSPPNVMRSPGGMLWRALSIYAAAFVAVAIVARAAVIAVGLPDWVFTGALVVMALGLPVILFTGFVHRSTVRRLTTTPTRTPGGGPAPQGTLATIAAKASPLVSWRRTGLGGVYAVGAFVVIVGGFMLLRAMGIGPAATLLTRGTLKEGAKVVLADIVDHTGRAGLSTTVTEALRVDLGQSRAIRLVQPGQVRETLGRMQRDPNERPTSDVAREIAIREGAGAVVTGEINSVGAGLVLSVQVVDPESGDVLLGARETASDSTQVIGAIERLSQGLREHIGESLRNIRSSSSLSEATTASLAALRKYSEAVRASDAGDFDRTTRLLREATALDTTFAEAYRKLAITLSNRGLERSAELDAMTRAFRHRERLPEISRHLVEANYYTAVQSDLRAAIRAYQAVLDIDSTEFTALNNMAVEYFRLRDYQSYRRTAAISFAREPKEPLAQLHNVLALVGTGRIDSAMRFQARFDSLNPGHSWDVFSGASVDFQRRDYDGVRRYTASSKSPGNAEVVRNENWNASADAAQGHIQSALSRLRAAGEKARTAGLLAQSLQGTAAMAELVASIRGDTATALALLRGALGSGALDSIPALERPYEALSIALTRAGDVATARRLLARADADKPTALIDYDGRFELERARGVLALADGRTEEAVRRLRTAASGVCDICALPDLGRAYEKAGQPDSALSVYQRYADSSSFFRSSVDGLELAPMLRRLGEMFENKGDAKKAIEYYEQFVALYKNADPALQPLVIDVRQRIARLSKKIG